MGRSFEVRKQAMAKKGMKKAKLYSKFSKEIYLIARSNPNEETNLELKRLIQKAKNHQVPTDVIKRSIDKVKNNEYQNYHVKRYEGFAKSGATIIINCLTDNDNRAISEVKNCFTKTNNKLGVSNAVTHM